MTYRFLIATMAVALLVLAGCATQSGGGYNTGYTTAGQNRSGNGGGGMGGGGRY
ncbi:hypothetical protein [Sinorhizobium sp. BG8]|uniref:hypothetical protein n=1 Tax=Sinorhizobium sp. BG8 TaxID=2613773 RepID=UPI00193CBB6F|nr:hypothetical protein [Sinorhizobium sp. BG8]